MKSPVKKQAPHALRFYQRWWILANAMTDGLLSHVWQAIVRFSKHGTREAAALSYYATFSLFPLLLLVIIVIGTALGPAAARNQIDSVLRLFLPVNTANFLQENIALALEQRGSFGLVAGVSLLWSSLGLFSSLSSALSRTFRDENPRNTWHQRLVGLTMMIALSVLLIASLAATVMFVLLDFVFFYQRSSWISFGAFIIPLSLSVAIFAFLYRFIPRQRVRWDAIWVAAFIGGGLWELAKRLFTWYLDNLASYNLVYGSVATMIVLMFWIYLTGIIVLLGAEICVSLDDWMTRRAVHELRVPSPGVGEAAPPA
ncbi:MAG: YihY/virulence factor BrkB family protein [Chloroflexota bacterium]|nr:YihY/virulence factor BrkB family protein [Anaerolineae bacterium]HMM28268.1 YihY/virulence factor BrkB family protein [Aggregatilineaceae bacterium]